MQFQKIMPWILLSFSVGLIMISSVFSDNFYILITLLMVGGALFPFFLRFERKQTQAKEIALIAMLATLATVGRILFAPLPNIKPTSFVILMAGWIFGAEAGFMVGAVTAVSSNLFFGQGPWTPWQMFAWGLMGFTAGMLRDTLIFRIPWLRIVFGFAWGFLFGWVMDGWFILSYSQSLTWEAILAGFVGSFYFDLAHALSNAVLMGLFSKAWYQKLMRIKCKYGLESKRIV